MEPAKADNSVVDECFVLDRGRSRVRSRRCCVVMYNDAKARQGSFGCQIRTGMPLHSALRKASHKSLQASRSAGRPCPCYCKHRDRMRPRPRSHRQRHLHRNICISEGDKHRRDTNAIGQRPAVQRCPLVVRLATIRIAAQQHFASCGGQVVQQEMCPWQKHACLM